MLTFYTDKDFKKPCNFKDIFQKLVVAHVILGKEKRKTSNIKKNGYVNHTKQMVQVNWYKINISREYL